MKGRSKVILGSPKAVRSGPERGQRAKVTAYLFYCQVSMFGHRCVCLCVCVLPVSREDKSLSVDRPGERGLAVWTVGVVIWPR